MAQIILGGKNVLNIGTDLDPMFTELYGLYSLFTIAGSNVGLGGAPSTDKFAVAGPGSANILSTRSTDASGARVALQAAGAAAGYAGTFSNHPFILVSNGVERMNFDTAGNIVSPGKFGLGRTPAGEIFESSRAISIHGTLQSAAGPKMALDHNATTGASRIMAFGATTGAAGTFDIYQASSNNSVFRTALSVVAAGHVQPGTDNAQTLGASANRWSVVYAGTGTINTSDARDKTPVAALTAAELAAATELAREVGTYRFLEAVAAKGEGARMHAGMTVQRAIEVMQGHGLDPLRYGFICYDEWEEVQTPATIEERQEETGLLDQAGARIMRAYEVEVVPAHTRPAGNRYSFRTDELLLFIARGFDERLSALEAG